MPTISMFYGILIRIFTDEHNPPHFHAKYGEYTASFSFDGDLLDGDLPRKQMRLVQAWTELHRDELVANWELAVSGEALFKIKPLD